MTMPTPAKITGSVELKVAGETMRVEVTVPVGPTPLMDLLPLFNALTSSLVERAVQHDTARGHVVSCRAACGACCRQPVPLAPSEARAMAALIEAMPEPRQSVIRERFAAGGRALDAAGVRIALRDVRRMDAADRKRWVADYMRVGVACPFLEDESCSIYPDRPTICREYLVTSPAENCRAPMPGAIRGVPVPGLVSSALAVVDETLEGCGQMLLADCLDWVAATPAPAPVQTGPALVEAVFATLARDS